MKEGHIKTLLEKYKNGETTLEEELLLIKNSDKVKSPLMDWVSFEQKNQKKVPESLNDTLWDSFEEKTKPKHKILKSIIISAAAIALLFTLYVKNIVIEAQTIEEKEALLKEAKSLFAETNEEDKLYKVLFENELVVVYTK